jgi:hypothetical protein
LIELGEKLVLSVGNCLCGGGSNLSGCFGPTDGGFGFGGEEGTVALGVGVAFSYRGGDAGCASPCSSRRNDGGVGRGTALGAAGTMSSKPFGYLLL